MPLGAKPAAILFEVAAASDEESIQASSNPSSNSSPTIFFREASCSLQPSRAFFRKRNRISVKNTLLRCRSTTERKIMYRYYVVAVLLFLSTLLAAQEKRGEISGQIIDGTTQRRKCRR